MSKKVKIKEIPSKVKILDEKKRSSNLEEEIKKEESLEFQSFVSSDSSSSDVSSPLIPSSSESSSRPSSVSEEESSSSLREQKADAPFAYISSKARSQTQDARTYSEPSNPSLSPVFHPEDNRSREVANSRFFPMSSAGSSSNDFREEADKFAREYEEKKKKRYPWQA